MMHLVHADNLFFDTFENIYILFTSSNEQLW